MTQRTKKQCSIDGCENKLHARGWCKNHYEKNRLHGTPNGLGIWHKTPEESFAARTEWQGACLIWTGAKNSMGYGQLGVQGKTMYAHRYSWMKANGPIPNGAEIDHVCHTPLCCNPRHLRIATREENTSHIKGAQKNSRSGFRNVYPRGSKWYVQIRSKGVIHSFGSYDSIEEASEVAHRERKKLHGEFFKEG